MESEALPYPSCRGGQSEESVDVFLREDGNDGLARRSEVGIRCLEEFAEERVHLL